MALMNLVQSDMVVAPAAKKTLTMGPKKVNPDLT
eukprot:CAMPEP_0170481682 /NCGR_PEP_ID=MMETSP0208-20121228/2035_1 /TAXON_ID=197538 /ORGANISM="Strombidium inclinatum, Strain S3" /LENGTH=33 /DNA_ID= /DNA_START= /DNA_END= /DNA_ORIENTATION=